MKMDTSHSIKVPDMDYLLFPSGHSWKNYKCTNCGTERQQIYSGNLSHLCYSKNGFKTIDKSAGKCFKKII